MSLRRYGFRAGGGLLSLVLVASVLAVSAGSAAATSDTPDEKINLTACLGEALEDWDFTDVSTRHAFYEPINCLAHYGITIGSGDGSTFAPDEPVKRWQMMLFLARALQPVNVKLDAARDQKFVDVDHLGAEARDAINLLVTNGIATAAVSRAFEPDAVVDRAEMALLLIRFLDAVGSVVNFDNRGNILLDADADGSQSQSDDYFQDARDTVPVAVDAAISAAYELGITTGAGPTPASGGAQPGLDFYYRPRDPVTRGQMAAFIIRTLAHTLARPEGLSAQYDGNEIRVSIRDRDFEPVVDAPVDMFFVEADDVELAFTSRGVCDEVDLVDGSEPCEIDGSDFTTDDDGEVSLTVPQTILDGNDTMLWIWTGRDGEEVDRRTELFALEVEPSSQPQGAVSAKVSTAFRGSKARFGTSVTFTVQLLDARGNATNAGIDGQNPAEWTLTEELLRENPAADTVNGIAAGSGEGLLSKTPRTVRSDNRGRVTFSLSVGDPDRSASGQSRTRTFMLAPLNNAPAVSADDGFRIKLSSGRTGGEVFYLEFSDADPVLGNSVVTVTSTNRYRNVPSSGSVRNSAVVSVYDEYGRALSAAKVRLASSSRDTTISTNAFTVGRDGIHRFSYSYRGDGGIVETLTPTVDPDGKSETDNNLEDLEPAYVFWPVLTQAASTEDDLPVLFADLDRNSIVFDSDADTDGDDWPAGGATVPRRLTYDSNDRFDVQQANQSKPRAVADIDAFEEALAEAVAEAPGDDAGTGACLQWSGYDSSRSRVVAQITLKLTGCS